MTAAGAGRGGFAAPNQPIRRPTARGWVIPVKYKAKREARRGLLFPFPFSQMLIGRQRGRVMRASMAYPPMSAYGYKQTWGRPKSMSAIPPTGDIPRLTLDFRL